MDDQVAGADASGPAVPSPTMRPPGATPGVPGWYADPFSSTRRRWWTGQSWTFSTLDGRADDRAKPPPPPVAPVEVPVADVRPKEGWAARARRLAGSRRLLAAVVIGLVLGLLGARILVRSTDSSDDAGIAAPGRGRTGSTAPPATSPPPLTNTDPSAPALSTLIVRPPDVTSPFTVTLVPGGNGLSRATLDLCNGTFASESRRTARLQDAVIDDQGDPGLSTEAVLYDDSSAATQAFGELKAVAAACPSTPVDSPVGEPTVITTFKPAPDGSWPQTPTVARMAFDFTTTDDSGAMTHSIAVYLQRGRALVGVYFFQPDGPQAAVAGQTTVPGIVGVFAGRLAALPTSVVGS